MPFLIPTMHYTVIDKLHFQHIYKKILKDKHMNKMKFLVGIGLFDLSVNKVVKSFFFLSFHAN